MGFFTHTIAAIEWRFPVLMELVELPPFKRNDHVIHTPPSGARFAYAATVKSIEWDDSMGLNGEWAVRIAYFPYADGVQDTSKIWETVCSPKSLEKVQ